MPRVLSLNTVRFLVTLFKVLYQLIEGFGYVFLANAAISTYMWPLNNEICKHYTKSLFHFRTKDSTSTITYYYINLAQFIIFLTKTM